MADGTCVVSRYARSIPMLSGVFFLLGVAIMIPIILSTVTSIGVPLSFDGSQTLI